MNLNKTNIFLRSLQQIKVSSQWLFFNTIYHTLTFFFFKLTACKGLNLSYCKLSSWKKLPTSRTMKWVIQWILGSRTKLTETSKMTDSCVFFLILKKPSESEGCCALWRPRTNPLKAGTEGEPHVSLWNRITSNFGSSNHTLLHFRRA